MKEKAEKRILNVQIDLLNPHEKKNLGCWMHRGDSSRFSEDVILITAYS
jgi:hypothetical protein